MKQFFIHLTLTVIFSVGLFSNHVLSQKAYYSKDNKAWADDVTTKGEVEYTVYLIGDAGESDIKSPTPLNLLYNKLKNESENSSVIFLGDNIYPAGLPPADSPERIKAESDINAQLDILKDYPGKITFIPGNHDWDRMREKGLERIIREEEFIEAALNKGNTFLPDNGCSGPVEVPLGGNRLLLIIDTQWWVHKFDKPYVSGDSCGSANEFELIEKLQKIAAKNQDKQIILAGHHPLYTNGSHGGHFTISDHLFPLRALNKKLYIPLPVIGSIYPILRKSRPHIQDVGHDRSELLKEGILSAFKGHENFIYAAGHEHSLQYFEKEKQHFIVSGSGSKTTHVAKRNGASFNISKGGFSKVIYMNSGETWIEFWTVSKENPEKGELTFRKRIKEGFTKEEIKLANEMSFKDSTILIAAGEQFKAGKFKSFWLGAHHRNAWTTPIKVNLLDLGSQNGGLKPIKLGGGMQTKSLRLANPEGTQFVFRSIAKNPARFFLPKNFQNSWAADLMKDQISMAHPYGAFAIPTLAEGAGILHKHSQLVYIPNDRKLDRYQGIYKNTLALFEERANKNISQMANFGYADRAIGTPDLIELLHNDTDNRVDEADMLTNRLFDMLVGDFDRHDDQWRWAEFECEKDEHDVCMHVKHEHEHKGKVYRPVPRDRDQVFAKVDGVIPWLASRKFSPGRFLRNFDYEINDIVGLNINGSELDQTFLTRLTKDNWIAIAEKLKQNLTDSVIESAFKVWEDTIYQMSAPEIISKLKKRRNDIVGYATDYYAVLAKEVEIVGSNHNEFFEIYRMADGRTKVSIHKKHKHNSEPFYSRIFNKDETDEIRLYGLDGDDRFEIFGNVKSSIVVRIIGGDGNDMISDISTVSGLKKHTHIYDTEKGTIIKGSTETKNRTSDNDVDINSYVRGREGRLKPDFISPIAIVGVDPDNGLSLGAGFSINKHGWRKGPLARKHTLTARYALKTEALKFKYVGDFYQVIDKWNIHLEGIALAPNNSTNFYGLGNETKLLVDNEEFYDVSLNNITGKGLLGKQIGKSQKFSFGPKYQYTKIGEGNNGFIGSGQAGLPNSAFQTAHFAGFEFNYELNTMSHPRLPKKGIKWSVKTDVLDNLTSSASLSNFSSEFSFVKSFNLPFKPIFSARIGGATIIGDYEFYQANVLGSLNVQMERGNLRGYQRDRFSGRSVGYQNADLRLELFKVNTYLFPGVVGVLGFLDHGRVWADNESSDKWHRGYGGGVWMSILDNSLIVADYEKSEEGNFITIRTSFLF